MKLVTFRRPGDDILRPGVLLEDERVLDLESAPAGLPAPTTPWSWFDLDDPCHAELQALLGDPGRRVAASDATLALRDVRLGPPVTHPRKVLCIGLNYRDHAEESGLPIPELPLMFSKFPTSIVGPEDPVLLPEGAEEVDYEAELGVVIGRRVSRPSLVEARNAVLGYLCLNDVSARDFQFKDGQWQRGKSCDTFCPIGPYLATSDEIGDPEALRIQLRLNGATLQDSNTDQLIFGIGEIVRHVAQTVTLEPGDLIATGTPPGVGFARKPPVYLGAGDRMEVEIEGLGVLANPVAR